MMKNTLIPLLHTLTLAGAIVAASVLIEGALVREAALERDRDEALHVQVAQLTDTVAHLVEVERTRPASAATIVTTPFLRPCEWTNSGCYDEDAAIAANCKGDAACVAKAWGNMGWITNPWSLNP